MEALQAIGPTARALALSLVKAEAEKLGVATADVLGPSHMPKVARARQHAIASIYTSLPGWTQSRIARLFHRDHTTIHYTLKKMGVHGRKAV